MPAWSAASIEIIGKWYAGLDEQPTATDNTIVVWLLSARTPFPWVTCVPFAAPILIRCVLRPTNGLHGGQTHDLTRTRNLLELQC
jgi:hypothetical protein